MADAGCQSCLTGLKIMKKLGLSTRDLIPVDIKMHATDNHNIRILGATIPRLSGKNNKGEEQSTRQIVYVTDKTDSCCLCRLTGPPFPRWVFCINWALDSQHLWTAWWCSLNRRSSLCSHPELQQSVLSSLSASVSCTYHK